MEIYDVTVIGGGPAGLAAGLAAEKQGAKTLIIEREKHTGGILKQCIHDGFGLIRFGEKLSGPEYAERYIKMVLDSSMDLLTSTFVTNVKRLNGYFQLTLLNSLRGVFNVTSKTLILANGCRERTAKQASIHGTRPAGVYTAGLAQHLVNISGYLPCKKCVVFRVGRYRAYYGKASDLRGCESGSCLRNYAESGRAYS